jgi:hypothetical protein
MIWGMDKHPLITGNDLMFYPFGLINDINGNDLWYELKLGKNSIPRW